MLHPDDFKALSAYLVELRKEAGLAGEVLGGPAAEAAHATVGIGRGLFKGTQHVAKKVTGFAIDHPGRAAMLGLLGYGGVKMIREMNGAVRGAGEYARYPSPIGPQIQGGF